MAARHVARGEATLLYCVRLNASSLEYTSCSSAGEVRMMIEGAIAGILIGVLRFILFV